MSRNFVSHSPSARSIPLRQDFAGQAKENTTNKTLPISNIQSTRNPLTRNKYYTPSPFFVTIFQMIFFLATEALVLFIIIYLFYLLSWFWPPDSPWAPWWKTEAKVARAIQKLAKISKNDLVYELGSGDGESLITFAKEFQIPSVGIEVDPLRVVLSKFHIWRKRLGNMIRIVKKDFFKVDISEATVVYVYLVPRALEKLRPKFEKELKPGTRVISYRYEIPYLSKIGENKEHKLFLYEIQTSAKT